MRRIILMNLILVLAFLSCKVEEPEQADHGHDHDTEEVKLQITEYTDSYELFAEADPFVTGVTSEILAHFSTMPDFKPLKDAVVTASLTIGKEGIRQTIENAVRPGIYKFALKPLKSGAGQLIFDIKTSDRNYQVVSNIVVYKDKNTADLIAGKKQVDQVNSIIFTKEQSWKIDFATVKTKKEQFGKVIKTTARILPNQNSETIVAARTNGIVKLTGNILEGQELISGTTLFTISGKGLANENTEVRFLEAKNNYEAAKSDYDRKLALSKDQIVSEKEVESARAVYENTKAVFDNLKNRRMILKGEGTVRKES
jgi:hypothetical protein